MISAMQRMALAIGLVWLATLSACATQGGSSNDVKPRPNLTAADFYPLTPGWKWAYDVEREGMNMLATYAVDSRTGDTAVVQAGDEKLTYTITPEGVAQVEAGAAGDFVIKNPVVQGAEWPVTGGKARIDSVGADFRLDSGEHYLGCIVVQVTRTEPVRITRTTFAPDLGPVALEMQVQDGPKFVTTTRARLRAVTRPGDRTP